MVKAINQECRVVGIKISKKCTYFGNVIFLSNAILMVNLGKGVVHIGLSVGELWKSSLSLNIPVLNISFYPHNSCNIFRSSNMWPIVFMHLPKSPTVKFTVVNIKWPWTWWPTFVIAALQQPETGGAL